MTSSSREPLEPTSTFDDPNSIPPLQFDTDRELDQVLNRMKRDLKNRCFNQQSTNSRAKASTTTTRLEEIVLKGFFEKVEKIVKENCTIQGYGYHQYLKLKRDGGLIKTLPLDEQLHQRVMKYQDDLFDAREVNARERKDIVERIKHDVEKVVELDFKVCDGLKRTIDQVEVDVNDDNEGTIVPRRIKKKDDQGITMVEAQEYFEIGKRELSKINNDVPTLTNVTKQTIQTCLDAAKIN